jgi:hypothetical protein
MIECPKQFRTLAPNRAAGNPRANPAAPELAIGHQFIFLSPLLQW